MDTHEDDEFFELTPLDPKEESKPAEVVEVIKLAQPPSLYRKIVQGRPVAYSRELAENLCFMIATTTSSLRKICEHNNISYATVWKWLQEKPDFAALYARAKEAQMDELVEEMQEIADDLVDEGDMAAVQQKKLQIDVRKFTASKLKSKVYGNNSEDKLTIEHNHNVSPEQFQAIMDKLKQKKLNDAAAERNGDIEQAEYTEGE